MTNKDSNLAPILEKLKSNRQRPVDPRDMQEIVGPTPKEDLLRDQQKAELLVDSHPDQDMKGMKIYRARGEEIPHVIRELGRLREATFRTVGEGTGLSSDTDRFDPYYDHFWAWDKKTSEITGAYRIGRVDKILAKYGPDGVYTNTLFNLEPLLKADFRTGTLEAGRSFVRPEFQRGLTLLYIWTGLGRFVCANPDYKYLMGPVSISNEFHEASKHLMVSFLMKNFNHEKAELVTSKNPPTFETDLSPEELTSVVDNAIDLSALQDFVRMVEDNPRAQIPQLIKLYLELGVRFLAFNKDDDFNSIDGLIWLDITKIPKNIGHRYMGEEGFAGYKAHHGMTVD
ncbi:MAG: GNAT family N-acetyltransferase [Bdellovibrionales bacterium]